MLDWTPYFGHGRSRGRPRTRWSDQIENFAGGGWKTIAEDSVLWDLAENVFAAPPVYDSTTFYDATQKPAQL